MHIVKINLRDTFTNLKNISVFLQLKCNSTTFVYELHNTIKVFIDRCMTINKHMFRCVN